MAPRHALWYCAVPVVWCSVGRFMSLSSSSLSLSAKSGMVSLVSSRLVFPAPVTSLSPEARARDDLQLGVTPGNTLLSALPFPSPRCCCWKLPGHPPSFPLCHLCTSSCCIGRRFWVCGPRARARFLSRKLLSLPRTSWSAQDHPPPIFY